MWLLEILGITTGDKVIKELEADLEQKNKELEELKEQDNRTKRDNIKLKNIIYDHRKLNNKYKEKVKELEITKSELSKIKDKLERLEGLDGDEINSICLSCIEKEKTINNLRSTLNVVYGDLSKQTSEIKKYKKLSENRGKELSKIKDKLERLEDRNAKLKKDLGNKRKTRSTRNRKGSEGNESNITF